MKTRVEAAVQRHKQGYNCAQAVACTYCDLVGLDEATMFRLTEGLGLGMGNMEGTCGAIAAACVLAGLQNSSARLEQPDSKGSTYRLSKALMNAFAERAGGSVICKEIKGVETGTVLHTCPDCVRDAAAIVEQVLFQEEAK